MTNDDKRGKGIMMKNAPEKATKTPRPKWNNVGLPPEVDRELERLCAFYGWSKRVAVERMVKKELAAIDLNPRSLASP